MKKIKWILSLLGKLIYVMFGGHMIVSSISAFKDLKEEKDLILEIL